MPSINEVVQSSTEQFAHEIMLRKLSVVVRDNRIAATLFAVSKDGRTYGIRIHVQDRFFQSVPCYPPHELEAMVEAARRALIQIAEKI